MRVVTFHLPHARAVANMRVEFVDEEIEGFHAVVEATEQTRSRTLDLDVPRPTKIVFIARASYDPGPDLVCSSPRRLHEILDLLIDKLDRHGCDAARACEGENVTTHPVEIPAVMQV